MSSSAPAPVAAPLSDRLQSLDVYRGLIMISLACNGFGLAATARNHLKAEPDSGFWRVILHQFEHAEWRGGGYWDLIQPSFMFMVGVSMAYSYVRRQREGESWGRMFGHACWRSVALAALGIFLISNGRNGTEWSLMNVLTQIGLGYPFLFMLWGRPTRLQAAAVAVILLGSWALYTAYPAPGISPTEGAPKAGVTAAWAQQHLAGVGAAWHKNANVGHAIDTWLLNLLPRSEPFVFNGGGYQSINFLPSLATMLLGLMAGELLRSGRAARDKVRWLLLAGVAGLVLGLLGSALGCPLVKRIWTPSWALWSTGWCALILGTLYWAVDVRQWRGWSFPLVIVGMNSLAIYAMGMLLRPWTAKTFQTHLGADIFKVLGPANAPFMQATVVGLMFWLACWWLHRRRIFLRL
jgi:predicted acyltransferase